MAVIRFFASVRDKMGTDSVEVTLSAPVPLRDVLRLAAEGAGQDPAVLTDSRLMYAVNRDRRGLEHVVNNDDEVAVLPPLSGGV